VWPCGGQGGLELFRDLLAAGGLELVQNIVQRQGLQEVQYLVAIRSCWAVSAQCRGKTKRKQKPNTCTSKSSKARKRKHKTNQQGNAVWSALAAGKATINQGTNTDEPHRAKAMPSPRIRLHMHILDSRLPAGSTGSLQFVS